MRKKKVLKVKIEDIKLNYLNDIQPYQSPEQKEEINEKVAQLRKYGQLEPIRLNEDYTIIDGHLRLFAAIKLGLKEIDATIVSSLKEI
jgi:ParB-like chromosome segregation protein Spo0J